MTERWKSMLCRLAAILVIVLVGPGLGIVLAAYGVVLAPPQIFFTGLLYLALPGLALPIGLFVLWRRRVRLRELLIAWILTGIMACCYLAIIGPWLPGDMTACQPAAASAPQVRYLCVSTSSDSPSARHEFTLEGWSGWPVMRLTHFTSK